MSGIRVVSTLLFGTAFLQMAGCVTPIPLAQEAPDLSYTETSPMVVAVIDERQQIAQGKPPTYLGRAHGAFGIPSDMETYPWFVSDKQKKGQTLAEALEERIVVGLNDEGWALVGAGLAARPTKAQTVSLLAGHNAQRLVQFVVTQWFVSINLNWVTAFNFDWGYELEVLNEQGLMVARIADSGRDVVDEDAKQSPQNTIKMAFRERLVKIFEQPDVRAALTGTRTAGRTGVSSGPTAAGVAHGTASKLRAVGEADRAKCEVIDSITRGAGGSGDISHYLDRAMDAALSEAASYGADAYFVVESETNGSSATVVLEALRCE